MSWPTDRPGSGGPGARARVPWTRYLALEVALVPLLLALAAWTLQRGPLDAQISSRWWDPASRGFPLRDSPWLEAIGHQAARGVPVLVGGIALATALAGLAVPALRRWRAIALATGLSIVVGPLAVALLKDHTAAHCPYLLDVFGSVIDYRAEQSGPFWARTLPSAGHCLPSGHAAGGFALLALHFTGWAAGRPGWRWSGLAIGIGVGVAFSLVRIAQGAHFASQTLWSAPVDWAVAALLFAPLLARRQRAPGGA